MKSAKSVLVLTIFSTLSLIGGALPQRPESAQQVDQDRIEAAR